DRAQLAGERPPGRAAFARGIGGHAADHAGVRWFGVPMVNSRAIPAVIDMSQPPRPSGRAPGQMREATLERGYPRHAEGSVLVASGETRVLCTASVENRVPGVLRGEGSGWVTAEYGMLPRATNTRTDREAARGKQGGRTLEIQRLIGRSLRACIDRDALGERTITLD